MRPLVYKIKVMVIAYNYNAIEISTHVDRLVKSPLLTTTSKPQIKPSYNILLKPLFTRAKQCKTHNYD